VPGEKEIDMADLSISGDTLDFYVREPKSCRRSTVHYHQGLTITSGESPSRQARAQN
jgi:hypothetical protein